MSLKTSPCKKCGKRFRTLTKENLCAFCYKDVHNSWAKEFTSGKESLNQMKFKGGKKKK